MTDDETKLDRLFENYRAACPEIEPGALFMPRVWQRIEARQGFAPIFEHLTRLFASSAAAVCLLLLVLNLVSTPHNSLAGESYTDGLVAQNNAEQTYYSEATLITPPSVRTAAAIRH
ncbi:MAG: hypothetical protein ACRD34_13195 [Bryobacteraceae bacterium]